MKTRGLFTIAALVLAAVACNDSGVSDGEEIEAAEPEQIGTLALNLVGADSDGRQYRLRNAEFYITSFFLDPQPRPVDGGFEFFQTSVSSEDNLEAARISLTLVPGQYNVELRSPDWYLERNTEGSWERVEQAALLSPAYQYAYVYDQGVVAVNYRFGVDGELIDFRSGELSIGIEIEQPGEGAPDAGFPPGIFGGIGGIMGAIGGLLGGGGTVGGAFGGVGVDAGAGAP